MDLGQATFETTAPDWPEWNRDHLTTCRMVARLEGQVIGWAALSPVSRRAVYAGVAEVSVYVAPASWGHDLGKALLEGLVNASEQVGIWTLQSSIFPENLASLAIHKAYGFRELGFRERVAQTGRSVARHGVIGASKPGSRGLGTTVAMMRRRPTSRVSRH